MRGGLFAVGALLLAETHAGNEPIHADGFEDAACAPLYAKGYHFEWNDLYFQGWPGYNQVVRFIPPPESYVSLRFTAGPAGQLGELLGVPVPPGANSAGWVAISRVPGCFDPAFNASHCVSEVAGVQSVTWISGQPGSFRCELVPGQTYYVNLTLGRDAQGGPGPYCQRSTELCILELGQFLN
ncbi:MAG: hypothetical protein DYH17_02020 [Xanthomonadales bacterium PRO6]|nr:hypothetical protein [Xanthomonadales bacterium PRO6]